MRTMGARSHLFLRGATDGRASLRIGIGLLAIVMSGVLIAPPVAMSATATTTYVPGCGSVSNLAIRPHSWSGGCTAGSGLVVGLHWIHYGTRRAVAIGKAVVGESANAFAHTKIRRYKARFVMSHPRACPNDSSWSYFYTERLTITYPKHNPWGKRPGRHTRTIHPLDAGDECLVAPS